MLLHLFIIFLFLSFVKLLFIKSKNKFLSFDKIPGPKPLPILGNILDIPTNTMDFVFDLCKLSEKYKGLFKLKIPIFGYCVVTTTPSHFEQVLSSSALIDKSNFYHLFYEWLGNGVGGLTGDTWKATRKIFSTMFNTKIVDGFCTEFDEVNKDFVESLKNHLNEPFDIAPLIDKNNMQHVYRTLLGNDVKQKIIDKHNNNYVSSKQICLNRCFSLRAFDFIFKYSKDYKTLRGLIESSYTLLREIIEDRKLYGNFSKTKTLLDLALEYDKNNPENPIPNLETHLDNFVFASHDTTSSILSLAIFELSCNKAIQDKLFEESIRVFGPDLSAELTMKQLSSAQYLDMFCKEVLRKYPAYPLIGRNTNVPFKLDDIDIPVNTQIVMLTTGMQRSARYYDEPLKFDPERFRSENSASRHEYAHVPFSRGPRNCLAQNYGLLIIKSSIMSLVRNFILSKGHPDFETKYAWTSTVKPLNGVLISLELRKEDV